jgi:hypothetical protein
MGKKISSMELLFVPFCLLLFFTSIVRSLDPDVLVPIFQFMYYGRSGLTNGGAPILDVCSRDLEVRVPL